MTTDTTPSCANCQRLQTEVDALRAQHAALQATVEQLQKQLAAARKDSSNSSKPPSSDIVKPPKPSPPPGQERRKPGGQPGHASHQRDLFPPEMLASSPTDYLLGRLPRCGGHLLHDRRRRAHRRPAGRDRRRPPGDPRAPQPSGLVPPLPARPVTPRFPLSIERGGLVGPRLTALIAYLKGVCHASFSTVRKFLRDVVGLTISRGMLAKVVAKVSVALERPYQELLERLPDEDRLNVDETGHKDRGNCCGPGASEPSCTRCSRSTPHRSADVLLEVLGTEFDGVLGCDYFSAYRRYMREFDVLVQFCLAHLIRDVKYLTTLARPARPSVWGATTRGVARLVRGDPPA